MPNKQPTHMGTNRTGMGSAPLMGKEMVANVDAHSPRPSPEALETAAEIRKLRGQYTDSEPVGTMPPPTSLKGAAKALADLVSANKPLAFLNKLGERLAFERTGVRLYDALIHKVELAAETREPTVAQLREIRDEELRHFVMLKKTIEGLGADPTLQTPDADVAAVASMGIGKVISDPRTTVTQALHAIHIAELADNDSWQMLIDLANKLGHTELVQQFTEAKQREAEHVERVRRWTTERTLAEATMT